MKQLAFIAALCITGRFQVSGWADEKKSAEMGKALNAGYIKA